MTSGDLVISAGGRDWRAAQLTAAGLSELIPDLTMIEDLNLPLVERIFAFVRIAGALFLPLQPDLTPKQALAIFTSEHVAPIINEVGRQARAARTLNHMPTQGHA